MSKEHLLCEAPNGQTHLDTELLSGSELIFPLINRIIGHIKEVNSFLLLNLTWGLIGLQGSQKSTLLWLTCSSRGCPGRTLPSCLDQGLGTEGWGRSRQRRMCHCHRTGSCTCSHWSEINLENGRIPFNSGTVHQ